MNSSYIIKKSHLFYALFAGRKELGFAQFPDILDMSTDMGQQITGAYNNDHAGRVFVNILADQFIEDLRQTINDCNFFR